MRTGVKQWCKESLPRLIRLQFFAVTGIVVFQVLGKSSVASMLFTATFFLTLLIWVCRGLLGLRQIHRIGLLILLCSGISVVGNGLITQTGVSFGYFRKWLMFCTTILFLSVTGEYCPDRKEIRMILRGSTFLSVFLVGMYGCFPEQMHLLNGRVSGYLTFRFTNPNLTAVFLSAISMLQWIQAADSRGIKRCLFAGLGGILIWFVIQTQSRNAQLVMAFFFLVWLLAIAGKGIALYGGIRWAAAVFPLLFSLGYLLLIRLPVVQRLFGFLAGEGKNLDSRVWIWKMALQNVMDSPLLGAYSQISNGTGSSQMHNSHLDVLASYGVPAFCLVCWLLHRLLEPVGRGRRAYLCRMAFLSLLLSGMGEAMLFSGGMGIYLLFGFFRMLANVPAKEEPV